MFLLEPCCRRPPRPSDYAVMIQQPPSGVPCEGCSRVCTMLVIGSALQVAACRGRRLHTVSGRLCSSSTLCAPSMACAPSMRPLHVLRALVVLLRPPGQPGHGLDLVVGQARDGLPLRLDRNGGHRVRGGQPVLQRLGRDRAPGDRAHDLVHQEVVRGDLAADHGLAEAPGRVDGDLRPVAVQRVEGERHPGRPRPDHLLHADAHRRAVLPVPPLQPVGDAPVGEQARPAAQHVRHDRVAAAHPQVGVVLAGEARVRLVLAGRRRPDRDGQVAVPALLRTAARTRRGSRRPGPRACPARRSAPGPAPRRPPRRRYRAGRPRRSGRRSAR